MKENPAVEVAGAEVRYGQVVAVREATLSIAPGETHVLLGRSGSGKTTLLRAFAGLERLSQGRVSLAGRVVEDAGVRSWTPPEQRSVGFVFQDYALFPHLDVARNVAFGHRGETGEVTRLLERVGLEGYGGRMPSELSGGQQQRVALARALAQRPQVLLLDEPFSNVDAALRRQLRRETLEILRAEQVTAVFVTHDVGEAFALGDRLSVMSDARLLQTGTPRELYERPNSEAAALAVGDAVIVPATPGAEAAETVLGRVPVRAGSGDRLLLRPEQVRCGETGVPARVLDRAYLGADVEIEVAVGDLRLRLRAREGEVPSGDTVHLRVDGAGVLVA